MSAISTNISVPSYTNQAVIDFTITFGEAVNNFIREDIVPIGDCSVVALVGAPGSSVYVAKVSPNSHGVSCGISVPADVASSIDNLRTNAANSNTTQFNGTRPKVQIFHNLIDVVSNEQLRAQIVFERAVVGFDESSLSFTNAALKSISGDGSTYQIEFFPIDDGIVKFSLNDSAGTDLFGNTSLPSAEVVFTSDFLNNSLVNNEEQQISDDFIGEIPDYLSSFPLGDFAQVKAITDLADCAKNIPQRLLDLATQKLFDIVSENENVKQLTNMVSVVQNQLETINSVVAQLQETFENPETLLSEIAKANGLSPDLLTAKVGELASKYANVAGINDILGAISSLDLCGTADYYADGTPAAKPILTPTDVLPPEIIPLEVGVDQNTYDDTIKNQYDSFLFIIKDQLELDSSQEQTVDRSHMMTIVTGLAMSYHDDIVKTIDDTQDQELFDKYQANVEREKIKNEAWEQNVKISFANKTTDIGATIKRNADEIRAFFNKDIVPTGAPAAIGITTYSGPDKDFTTFLDIKPSQRPPAMAASWEARGYNIAKNEARGRARGIKYGTLNFSDAYTGAYGGRLTSDFSCASTRFPGGTILLLKNPDGSVYNPSGRNPSGRVTVVDTGNAKLTYKKLDVFTDTPEKYKNMNSVQVFLVSKGNQTSRQYRLAQSQVS